MKPYEGLLEYCRRPQNRGIVKLHGGFLPRPYAAAYMKAENDEARAKCISDICTESKPYIPSWAELDMANAFQRDL